jgi:formate-dependent nitrite reductase cytochrome c552 subunit
VVPLAATNAATTRAQCANCHYKEAAYQKNEIHVQINVDCLACHMPRADKVATGDPALFIGDVRSHLMAIDPLQAGQFDSSGQASLSQVSLDFACKSCHVPDSASAKSDADLAQMATGYHTRPQGP